MCMTTAQVKECEHKLTRQLSWASCSKLRARAATYSMRANTTERMRMKLKHVCRYTHMHQCVCIASMHRMICRLD